MLNIYLKDLDRETESEIFCRLCAFNTFENFPDYLERYSGKISKPMLSIVTYQPNRQFIEILNYILYIRETEGDKWEQKVFEDFLRECIEKKALDDKGIELLRQKLMFYMQLSGPIERLPYAAHFLMLQPYSEEMDSYISLFFSKLNLKSEVIKRLSAWKNGNLKESNLSLLIKLIRSIDLTDEKTSEISTFLEQYRSINEEEQS